MLQRTGKDRGVSGQTTVLFHRSEVTTAEPEAGPEPGACLIVIRGPQRGRQIFIKRPSMTIGRDVDADLFIEDGSISRRHATIVSEGDAIRIVDNGSSNGTFVNTKRLNADEPYTLGPEDQIGLGGTVLKFLPAGALEIRTFTEMERAANTDPVTQSFNRRYLLQALEAHVERCRSVGLPCSIVFLDLDHFKQVNDTCGHVVGDTVLREFASVISGRCLRSGDIFARYGGEEFVVVLAGTAGADACKVAERIRTAVECHVFGDASQPLRLTTSAGVAELTEGMQSGSELLEAADRALYVAKQGGRNRVAIG